MHPLPDQPLPEGWVYIEHPEIGRSEHPVKRNALAAWGDLGWQEAANQEPTRASETPAQPQSGPVTTGPVANTTAAVPRIDVAPSYPKEQ